jgi:hypothetical protein
MSWGVIAFIGVALVFISMIMAVMKKGSDADDDMGYD